MARARAQAFMQDPREWADDTGLQAHDGAGPSIPYCTPYPTTESQCTEQTHADMP